jgi:transcriptional regulator with XRE-family HTH domain
MQTGSRSVSLEKMELLSLGKRLLRVRKLRGISDAYLAAACRLTRVYISQIESGRHNVLFSELCEICEALRCDIAAVTKGILIFPPETVGNLSMYSRFAF